MFIFIYNIILLFLCVYLPVWVLFQIIAALFQSFGLQILSVFM